MCDQHRERRLYCLFLLALIPCFASCVASTKAGSKERAERESKRYAEVAPGAVKKQAAYDFGCTESSVAVTREGKGTWGAVGCSERHLYAVNCHNRALNDPADLQQQDCRAILIGPITQRH